jgi:hypothetical protein
MRELFVVRMRNKIYFGGTSMKIFTKTALLAISLILCAVPGFAVDVKAPTADIKSTVKATGDNAKTDAKASAVAGKESAAASAKAKLIDINTATDAELKAVPGIGDAFAAKIIAGRPYANKTQLKSRKIVPASLYEQVKDRLIAKQPQK